MYKGELNVTKAQLASVTDRNEVSPSSSVLAGEGRADCEKRKLEGGLAATSMDGGGAEDLAGGGGAICSTSKN